MMDKSAALTHECQRLSESCQYTSTSIYIWLRCLRWAKIVFTAVPLILGSLASWELLTSSNIESVRNMVAVFAFLAGLLPSIYAALKFDERLETYIHASGEFKNLEHRFRKLALVDSQKPFDEFEDEFNLAMQRYEQLSNLSLTTPEWCFKRAQKKVQSGNYTFDADTNAR
jgi:hypothetical protein